MSLRTNIDMNFSALLTAALDIQSGSSPAALRRVFGWQNGTGANQADRLWTDRRTLGPSATEDLDLAGGSLLDAFGQALTFTRIRGLIVAAAPGNANNVVLGGVANGLSTIISPAATGLVHVRPGGLVVFLAPDTTGYVVTADTADLLHVANSGAGTSVTYEIAIVGCSA